MFFHAKEGTLCLNGLQMDYITFGRGARPLIMIQGHSTRSLHGAAASLAWMYRIFAGNYKVYLFDRRKNLPESITVRDIACDIAAAMDHLSLCDADILGVSMGGMIAQHLAIDRPDLVRRMVLAVTMSRPNPVIERVVENWVHLAGQGHFKELIRNMTSLMYSEQYIRRYLPFLPLLTVLQKPRDVQRFIILSKACLTCRAYDELDKIQCPVLVIGAKKDQIAIPEASSEMAEKLQCALHMYENLGHAAYEEAKDFNSRVFQFLKGS